MSDQAPAALAAFGYELGILKRIRRAGWWHAGVRDPESVAEHTMRVAQLAALLAAEEGADPARASFLALWHDTQETRTGDLPHTISGLKTGWAFGWRTIIAAELVFGVAGEGGGLGFFINNARYFLRTSEVFAGLVTIAAIGILLDLAFTALERRTVLRWGMKSAS